MKGFSTSLYEGMQGLGSWNQLLKIYSYLKTCPTRFPGAQTASLYPELFREVLKVNSCSSTGFNLHRGRWQMPLLFCWQYSLLFRHSAVSDSLQPHGLQHPRPPCPSPSPRVCSNLCPLTRWCHPTISSSVTPFSSCLQSSPASGSFQMSWLFANKVLELQLQHQSFQWIFRTDFLEDWLVICLQSRGLSRVFSSTAVQKHQFFGTLGKCQFVVGRVKKWADQAQRQAGFLWGPLGESISLSVLPPHQTCHPPTDLCFRRSLSQLPS